MSVNKQDEFKKLSIIFENNTTLLNFKDMFRLS